MIKILIGLCIFCCIMSFLIMIFAQVTFINSFNKMFKKSMSNIRTPSRTLSVSPDPSLTPEESRITPPSS